MAKGAIDIYLEAAYKHFKLQPTFPPGALVEVGWIGKVKHGEFVAAIAIVLDSVTETFIRNVDKVSEWMSGDGRRTLKADHVVVTHVRRAKAGVIAMAQSRGGEVQLKTNVALGHGRIELATVGGAFSVVASSSTEFVLVPSGGSGLTTFYRVLYYRSKRGILDKIFGRRGHTEVDFPVERLERHFARGVTQFPYDEKLLAKLD
jgi:hypothetical protein